jgi:hypothetical protein
VPPNEPPLPPPKFLGDAWILGEPEIRANFATVLDAILSGGPGRGTLYTPLDVGLGPYVSNKLNRLAYLVSTGARDAEITAATDAAKDALERELDGTAPDVLFRYDPKFDEPPD